MRMVKNTNTNSFRIQCKRILVVSDEDIVDIAAVTDLVRNLLTSGWEYKTSIPTTISNISHYILVKRQ